MMGMNPMMMGGMNPMVMGGMNPMGMGMGGGAPGGGGGAGNNAKGPSGAPLCRTYGASFTCRFGDTCKFDHVANGVEVRGRTAANPGGGAAAPAPVVPQANMVPAAPVAGAATAAGVPGIPMGFRLLGQAAKVEEQKVDLQAKITGVVLDPQGLASSKKGVVVTTLMDREDATRCSGESNGVFTCGTMSVEMELRPEMQKLERLTSSKSCHEDNPTNEIGMDNAKVILRWVIEQVERKGLKPRKRAEADITKDNNDENSFSFKDMMSGLRETLLEDRKAVAETLTQKLGDITNILNIKDKAANTPNPRPRKAAKAEGAADLSEDLFGGGAPSSGGSTTAGSGSSGKPSLATGLFTDDSDERAKRKAEYTAMMAEKQRVENTMNEQNMLAEKLAKEETARKENLEIEKQRQELENMKAEIARRNQEIETMKAAAAASAGGTGGVSADAGTTSLGGTGAAGGAGPAPTSIPAAHAPIIGGTTAAAVAPAAPPFSGMPNGTPQTPSPLGKENGQKIADATKVQQEEARIKEASRDKVVQTFKERVERERRKQQDPEAAATLVNVEKDDNAMVVAKHNDLDAMSHWSAGYLKTTPKAGPLAERYWPMGKPLTVLPPELVGRSVQVPDTEKIPLYAEDVQTWVEQFSKL